MRLISSIGLVCVLVATAAASAATAPNPTVVPAASVKWMPYPGMSGLSEAVVYGTPNKTGSGTFALLLNATSNVTFPAHWHPGTEYVTVIKGTLLVGVGAKVNWASAVALSPGSFVAVPAGLRHYAMFKAGTEIKVSGMAPFAVNVVK
jgi:quercetin dioxygenase-like cupin family protein